jgi:uncharacterized OsmC-like protein
MKTYPRPNVRRKLIVVTWLAGGILAAGGPAVRAQPTHASRDWAQSTEKIVPADSLRDYLTRLRTALLAIQDQPEQQQPLTLRARVTAESRSGVRRLQIRNFQFLSDGARATGEFNLAAGSWPTVVGVLGSAVAQDFLQQAALKGIPLDELEVIFTGRPETTRSSGTGTRVTYPRSLAYTAYIVSPASDAELEALRQTVERVSPVLNLVTQPQAIDHGKLIHTPTPVQRPGRTLEGLREFLAEKRAAAQGARPPEPSRPESAPDRNEPPLKAHIKVEGGTGIRHIRTDTSNFQLIHDSPRYLAGHNLGPVAEEHILGVMITCLTHIYEIQASARNIALDTLELEVEGTLEPGLGSIATPPRYKDIQYTVRIGSPETKETIEQLQRAVEATCPIYNMLKDEQTIKGMVVRGPYRESAKAAPGS